MPAVAPLPPEAVRELLESHGYEVVAEDPFNWAFAKGEDDEPILVPKEVDLVPLEISFHIARRVGFNSYFDMLHQTYPDTYPADDSAIH